MQQYKFLVSPICVTSSYFNSQHFSPLTDCQRSLCTSEAAGVLLPLVTLWLSQPVSPGWQALPQCAGSWLPTPQGCRPCHHCCLIPCGLGCHCSPEARVTCTAVSACTVTLFSLRVSVFTWLSAPCFSFSSFYNNTIILI